MFIEGLGVCLFFFGACMMDSAELAIPAGFCISGLILAGIGILKGGRA